tara:strand:- start:122 stop:325 length:204 start_codon:yes stop_codon:yes gene_type:complete
MFNLYKKVYIIIQTKPEEKVVGCFENDKVINELKRDGYEYKSLRIPYYKKESLEPHIFRDLFEDLWY